MEKHDCGLSDDLKRFRASLEIDEDDLDRCLVEQPRLFYEVGMALAIAVSRRDGIALRLKELKAALYLVIRDTAARHNEKTREDSIKNRIILTSEIEKLEREYLDACTHAKKVRAMKEAYIAQCRVMTAGEAMCSVQFVLGGMLSLRNPTR
jgi:hypothetical protein